MHDSNGNSITIVYQIGVGAVDWNTSARIRQILDSRSGYQFGYTAGPGPHLVSINGPMGESYRFTMAGQTVSAPFGSVTAATTLLQEVVTYGLGTKHQMTYNGSGEMTQVVTPLGGDLRWSYRTYAYTGTGRSYREVTARQMTKASGAAQANWNVTPADGAAMHPSTAVSDVGANASKVWTFGGTGLAASYEERGPGGVALLHNDYGWSTDNGNVYVGSAIHTQNPGSSQVQTKSTQTLDTNGNITQSAVYDYGNLTTPAKTYNYTYLTDGNYTSRYIRNRVTQVTMTPAGGGAVTLATNTYDGYATAICGAMGMVLRSGAFQHDDANYGTGFVYRGNVTTRNSIGGSVSLRYESTGVAVCSEDGAGHAMGSAPSADTGYSLPGVLTPNGNSNLATTVTYASSWAVTSLTGPNGANGTTTYDGYGRPVMTKIPDGAETGYAYTYNPNTQTATLGSRWKRTTVDGFGRVTRVETGHDSTTVSQVDTEYAPCACSPLGKLWRVSMPYAPSGNLVWTTYA